GQRRRSPAEPDDRSRSDRAHHSREARSRSLAAGVLRGVGWPAQEAGDNQGAGRVSRATTKRQGFMRHLSITTFTRYAAVWWATSRTTGAFSLARSAARSWLERSDSTRPRRSQSSSQ